MDSANSSTTKMNSKFSNKQSQQSILQASFKVTKLHGLPTKDPHEVGGLLKRACEDADLEYAHSSNKKQKIVPPRGLVNLSTACFSNASLQLFGAAFSPKQITQLAANGTHEDIDTANHALAPLKGTKFKNALSELNQLIEGSSPVKLAPYLSKVLGELRSDQGKAADPRLFQRVFALGSGRKKIRESFLGTTQRDASEYLVELLPALAEENSVVRKKFEFELQCSTVCTGEGCDYRNEQPGVETHFLMQGKIPQGSMAVTTPRGKGKNDPTLSTTVEAVIQTALSSDMCDGATCEKCKNRDTIAQRTQMVHYPSHLLVGINRAQFQQRGGRGGRASRSPGAPQKDTTKVELNFGDIQVGEDGVVYRMTAMMQHEGTSTASGHFTAYRKVEEGEWALFDDEKVKFVPERNLADGVKGFCTVLLLERQSKNSPTMLPQQGLET